MIFKNFFRLINKIFQVFNLTSKKELFYIFLFSIILIFIETIGIWFNKPSYSICNG